MYIINIGDKVKITDNKETHISCGGYNTKKEINKIAKVVDTDDVDDTVLLDNGLWFHINDLDLVQDNKGE